MTKPRLLKELQRLQELMQSAPAESHAKAAFAAALATLSWVVGKTGRSPAQQLPEHFDEQGMAKKQTVAQSEK